MFLHHVSPWLIRTRARNLLDGLRAQKYRLCVAESCTGGMLSSALTAIPGASDCFWAGITSYDNQAKINLLSVAEDTLRQYGAVSAETVKEMVEGVLMVSPVDMAIAISGIAGPGGASTAKPVGTVYIGCQIRARPITLELFNFRGNRDKIRSLACMKAMDIAISLLDNH